MQPAIIGIYSPRPASGKSTTAQYLVEHHGYKVVKFAGPLKRMVRAFLDEILPTNDPAVIERYVEGDLKESPIPGLNGVTTRRIMQTIGTGWGRDTISKSLWVDAIAEKVRTIVNSGGKVVIDDLRFPNEYDTLRAMGAHLIRVDRPSAHLGGALPGLEGLLDGGYVFDAALFNEGTVDDLHDRIEKALRLYSLHWS